MDAMVFKIKDDNGFYKNKALHFTIGINLEGKKDLLGMWITNNEGAKFCPRVEPCGVVAFGSDGLVL